MVTYGQKQPIRRVFNDTNPAVKAPGLNTIDGAYLHEVRRLRLRRRFALLEGDRVDQLYATTRNTESWSRVVQHLTAG
ncbi:MAG: hypothetical protein AB7S38_18045 [Vulcanimicrobiota bacterium]